MSPPFPIQAKPSRNHDRKIPELRWKDPPGFVTPALSLLECPLKIESRGFYPTCPNSSASQLFFG